MSSPFMLPSLAIAGSKRRINYGTARGWRALSRPPAYGYYQEADLALHAAVLAHGIAETQPFVEGNKRTASLACIAFLEENGYRLAVSPDEMEMWILELSTGLTAEEFAENIRPGIRPM